MKKIFTPIHNIIYLIFIILNGCSSSHETVENSSNKKSDSDFDQSVCLENKVVSPTPFNIEYKNINAPLPVLNENSLPVASGDKFNININPENEIRKISRSLFGNNGAVWLGKEFLLNKTLKNKLKTCGVSLLRWPGGSTSDLYHFDLKMPKYGEPLNWLDIHDPSWAPVTGDFLSFTKEINATPMIVVNHGFSSYGHLQGKDNLINAANLAADWVEYCNADDDGENINGGVDWARKRTLDGFEEPFNVKYWEVGNEVFGDWEIGHVDGKTYGEHFIAFAKAMKNVDPDIFVGANAVVNFTKDGTTKWMKDLLTNKEAVSYMDFADIHDYFKYVFDNNNLPKPSEIKKYYLQIEEDKEELTRLFEKYTDKKSMPLFFGEYHLTHPQNPLNITLASGLIIATALGEFIKNGFAASAMWDIANEWKNGGDLGFVSRNHPEIPDYSPYPAYYSFYFFAKKFGDTLVESFQNNYDVHVYAGKFSDKGVSLIIVNPNNYSKTASVKIADTNLNGIINGWILDGPDFMGPKIFFNDISTIHEAAGTEIKEEYTYTSAFDPQKRIALPVRANSVSSFIIY
ncbi:MAG: hypothetical protein JXR91_02760 [Deltaproteobacteria bacterium]|nr:hypothetical protein [Deltaproteobacteria bacterium]